jgi:hypothetical protein
LAITVAWPLWVAGFAVPQERCAARAVIGSVRYDPLPMPAMLRLQRTLVALTAAYIAGFGIYAARQ